VKEVFTEQAHGLVSKHNSKSAPHRKGPWTEEETIALEKAVRICMNPIFLCSGL